MKHGRRVMRGRAVAHAWPMGGAQWHHYLTDTHRCQQLCYFICPIW